MREYDVAVIGAGVVGLLVARELTRTRARVVVLEKEHDVARGASGRNSGVVHPGFSVKPDTLKARLNVEGSRALPSLCARLDVPYREVGTIVVARADDELDELTSMEADGRANGLERLGIVDAVTLARLEPAVPGVAALHSPEGAIVDPHLLCYRIAASAIEGGCELRLATEVTSLSRSGSWWEVDAGGERIRARVVVNAAGVRAPEVSAMAGAGTFESHPCRGEYLILEKRAEGVPRMMVYPVPPKAGGLGVHFTPTIAGNTLVGPSAEFIDDGEDYSTSAPVLRMLAEEARDLCPAFDASDVIATMAGVRSKIGRGAYGSVDFVMEASPSAECFVNLVGIESPGLSASPAIAKAAFGMLAEMLGLREERPFASLPPLPPRFAEADDETRERLAADPDGRRIVCRCEHVTQAEVLAALRDPVGAASLAAVKARCRAGTGRCGGSFCGPRVLSLIEHEAGVRAEDVTLKGTGSRVVFGPAKSLWYASDRGQEGCA